MFIAARCIGLFVGSIGVWSLAKARSAPRRGRAVAWVIAWSVLVLPMAVVAEGVGGPPAVLFTDVEVGPKEGGPGNLGTPISIFGSRFGATKGNSTVTIGGVEVASYLVWGEHNATNPYLDMIVVQPGPGVVGGAIVVTVDGQASNSEFSFTPNNGAIFYVATNGSDTNPGTEAQPFKTILHAATGGASKPGDVILVRGGAHVEGEVWIRKDYGHGGVEGQPKTIRNYPGEFALMVNPERPFILDADYVCVSGLHFRNNKGFGMPDKFVEAQLPGHNKIINCSAIGPIDYDGIGVHGNAHIVAGNWCEVQGSSQGTQGHAMYVSVGTGTKILYNVLRGAPGYSLHVFDQYRGNASQPDFKRVIADLVVEGNVMTDSLLRSGMILAMGDEAGLGNHIKNVLVRNNVLGRNCHLGLLVKSIASDVRVINNTFFENGRQDVHLAVEGGALGGVEIRNNLFYHSLDNGYCTLDCQWYNDAHVQVGPGPTGVVVSRNGYFSSVPGSVPLLLNASDSSAITGSVGFLNPLGLDLRVLVGGSSIDAGWPSAEVMRDMLGITRPQGSAFDLGAHEFAGEKPPCLADCDASGVLTIDDFICFQTQFAVGDPSADCDASGSLNIDDFVCFQTNFAIGC